MPATIINVPAIDKLDEVINDTVDKHQGKNIYLYFYASIDPATGLSWCPDCVAAGPIIQKGFSELDDSVILVDVPVGDRPTWKDPEHPYRHRADAITAVPTLFHLNTKKRLVEEKCTKENLTEFLSESAKEF
ncbi:Thioredoxin domain-containing protein 17 [Mortierella sp. NVP85]|nr:Thioredoxin domain-containing protein 17 [Mortierella sp. NVP85]